MSFTGLSVLAVRFFARPATRIRTEGSWQRGRWIEGIPVPTDIKAVIQGIKSEELRSLAAGERIDDFRAIWTEASLRTSDDGAEPPVLADIVEDEFGVKWRIIQEGFRVEGPFTRCIGKKIDDRGRSLDGG